MKSSSKNIKLLTILGLIFTQIRKKKRRYHLLLHAQEKILVEECDGCHKFANDLVRHCRNIDCLITHNISCDDFVILTDYNNSSAKLIDTEAACIKKRPIQLSLKKKKASSYSQYENCIKIFFTVN